MQAPRPFVIPLMALLGLAVAAAAEAQGPTVITGHVRGAGGEPINEAQVLIESVGVSASTDAQGAFRLVVPAARALGQKVAIEARRLGYTPEQADITLSGQSLTHDFTLSANPLELGEVVVTGAGTESQIQKLGTVHTAVDSTLIKRAAEVNVVEALAAKAPGVSVVGTSGDPGSSSYIRIRGLNTIEGSGQPLIVVDGLPIDNSTTITGGTGNNVGSTIAPNRAIDINPNDIASVEILKGPSAAAIYGARAGQGVILITTKSGEPGVTRTTFQSSVQSDAVSGNIPLQTEYGQGTDGVAAVCAAPGCSLTSSSWGAKLPTGTPIYNHFNDLFRTGYTADNNLTISGGSERTQFYLSGEYMYQLGDIIGPNNHFQRTTVRLKASHQLTDDIRLGGNVAYADTRGAFLERGSNVSGLLLGALRTPPEFNNAIYIDSVTGTQRSYRYPEPAFGSATVSRGYDNPFFVLYDDQATAKSGRVFGDITGEWDPIDWLKLNEEVGLDYSTDERLEGLAQSSSAFPLGQVTTGDYKHAQIDQNLVATANYTVSPSFSGTFTLGHNLNSRSYRQIVVTGNGLIAPEPFKLSNTVDRSVPNDAETDVHTQSVFGQWTGDLWDQLHLTAGARYDGFSSFGTSQRWNWFPKASAAWEFLRTSSNPWGPLTWGKLRIAYGQTGTEPDAYLTINTLDVTAFGDDGWGPTLTPTQAGRGGIYSGAVKGQENLKPERDEETEGGFDLGLFSGQRVDAHFTYYHKLSKDVIFLAPLAPSSGFAFQAQNAAEIQDNGIEASLNLRPIDKPTFQWNIGLLWAKDNNKVLSLSGAEYVSLPNSGFTDPQGAAFVGYPLGELRGSDFVRCGRGIVDETYGNVDATCNLPTDSGKIWLAPNGKPLLDASYRPIANPNPDWTGSVRTSFTVKGLTLSGLLDIKHGGQIWNGTKGALTYFGTSANTLNRGDSLTFGQDFYQQFAFAGPGVGKKVLIDQNNWYQGDIGSGFTGPSAQFVENGGFVKLRELSLSYTFSAPWLNGLLGLDALDVRVFGRNLQTWTSYTGIDPETTLFGASVGQQGFDYFGTPQARSFGISFTLHR
jgi:TonB-linked SusC/RagA family outer membrane protein